MFTRDDLLTTDWYQERLEVKQRRDVALWRRHVDYLDRVASHYGSQRMLGTVDLAARRRRAEAELARVRSPRYRDELFGTLGADPLEPLSPRERRPPVVRESEPTATAAL